MEKRKIILVFLVIAAILAIGFVYFFKNDKQKPLSKKTARVIEENLQIPDTKEIIGNEGRMMSESEYKLPIKKGDEEIIVSKASYSAKESFNIASSKSLQWSDDAKLVFIKSLGAVTPEGKSSQWQIVFGSKKQKRGYEVIIQAEKIVSEKQIESKNIGYGLPQNWYDSGEALESLRSLPQFSDATVSAMNFFYNNDADEWRYAIATSFGNTSMPVK